MIAVKANLFEPGEVVATPGAIEALKRSGQGIWSFLARHLAGDWGVIDLEDKASNEEALRDGSRLMSAYLLDDDEKTKIWVITEAEDDQGNREATTVLLPDEY